MARLVALQLSLADGLLAALDATWAAGDAALPLDPSLPKSLTEELLASLRPAVLQTAQGSRELPDAPPVPPGTALVVTTSGSTGTPKGVVLSHAALDASVRASRDRLGAADGVPWLGVLPLHHVAGVSVVLRSRAAGREPSLHPRDTPQLLGDAEPSWVSLVPAQLSRLLDAGVDLARHAGVLLGGAAAPADLLARARATGARVVTSYGSTETCGGCVYDGVPLDGVEAALAADGRLLLRGPVLADGVRQAGGRIAPVVDRDGWLTTGDLARIDEDGRVQVLGRADDVVVSGGENVPLAPVRAALAALPGVGECAVVGLPDARWGTAVTAVVVPVGTPPTLESIRAGLGATLPANHRPTRLVLLEVLPRDELGKVTRRSVTHALDAP